MFEKVKLYLPGIVVAVAITALTFYLGSFWKFIPLSMLAFVVGTAIGNTIALPERLQTGIKFSSSIFIELSILFIAFEINLEQLKGIGYQSILGIVGMVLLMLAITIFLARKFNCPTSTGWLVGYGTAICGSNAIGALSPSISKNKEDAGIAIAVVTVIGSIAMLLMPMVFQWMEIDKKMAAFIIGASLHSVANVAGAGDAMGADVAAYAISIKLMRVALLSPTLFLFRYIILKNQTENKTNALSIPWYLIAFIVFSLVSIFIPLPKEFLNFAGLAAKLLLAVSMLAIGLRLQVKQLYQTGRKGLLFGTVLFAIQLMIIVGIYYLVK